MTQVQRDIRRKLRILNYVREIGNVAQICRFLEISREIFYRWKKAYAQEGEETPHINEKKIICMHTV